MRMFAPFLSFPHVGPLKLSSLLSHQRDSEKHLLALEQKEKENAGAPGRAGRATPSAHLASAHAAGKLGIPFVRKRSERGPQGSREESITVRGEKGERAGTNSLPFHLNRRANFLGDTASSFLQLTPQEARCGHLHECLQQSLQMHYPIARHKGETDHQ